MLTKLRRALLVPPLAQWRISSLSSKQTTAAYLIGVASLAMGVASIAFTMQSTAAAERYETRKLIDGMIAVRTAEVRAIAELDHNFHPSVDFTSQENVLAELERFNEYGRKANQTFNLAEVHRLFEQHGTEQQQAELSARANRVHRTSLAVSNFLASLANSPGPASREDLNRLAAEYLALLNDLSASRSDLYGFVTGVTGKYFGY